MEFRVNVRTAQLLKEHEDLKCVILLRGSGVSPGLSSGGCSISKKQEVP